MKPQEREFHLNGFRYAGQCWGQEGDFPILAIHGWLDNSASFAKLAPLLKGVQLLALDMAGHGATDHRVGLSDYPVWSETAEIFAIADAMGWDNFALLGHSRGAMMSFVAAAVFPQRISHLLLLDALTPIPIKAEQSRLRMVKSIKEIYRRLERERSCYPDYESAIQARCNSDFGVISQPAAALLAERGLVKLAEGYHWHADGKLWASSGVGLGHEQIDCFLREITAKTLILLGDRGIKTTTRYGGVAFEESLFKVAQQLGAKVEMFNDGHFLHMESAVEDVALSIQAFIQ